jgi:ComF family protein
VPIDRRASCSGCLRPLARGEAAEPRCAVCRGAPPAFDRLIAVWRYQPPLAAAIVAMKFRRLDFVAEALSELARAREPFAAGLEIDGVVPVPLAPLRRLARGFNQAERIACALAAPLGAPLLEPLRRTTLLGAAQSRLGRAARRAAAPGRFRARRSAELAGRRLLLVDDVVTTGATLRAAASALLRAGAAGVTAFALAATPDRSWLPGSP